MKSRVPISSFIATACGFVVLYIALFGLYPRYFDISWQEEVRLHDGSVIVVLVKNTYERRGPRMSRYDDAIRRRTQFTFDAGPGTGSVTFSTRLGIRLLDRVGATWYVVLHGQGPFGNHPDEPVDRWGHDFSMDEDRLIKLNAGGFYAVPWDEAPTGAITKPNFPVGLLPIEQLAKYDHKLISLNTKLNLKAQYPPGPGDEVISRPVRFGRTGRQP